MSNIQISQELLRQFAYDCFDVIVRDIKAEEKQENQKTTETSVICQQCA